MFVNELRFLGMIEQLFQHGVAFIFRQFGYARCQKAAGVQRSTAGFFVPNKQRMGPYTGQ